MKADLKSKIAGKVGGVANLIELKSQGVNTEMVNPQILKDHPKNNEFFGKQAENKYQKLKADIQLMGVLEPLICRRLDTGDLQILSGHTRRDVALELNLDVVPVIVKTMDDIRAELVLHMTNTDNRDMNEMVLARSMKAQKELIERLRETGEIAGKTSEILGEQYGMNARKVERVMALNKLIPELQELVESGKLKSGIAEQWAKLPEEHQHVFFQTFQESLTELTLAETQKLKKESDKLVAVYAKELDEAQARIEEKEKSITSVNNVIKMLTEEIGELEKKQTPDEPVNHDEINKLRSEILRLEKETEMKEKAGNQIRMDSARQIRELQDQLRKSESANTQTAFLEAFFMKLEEIDTYFGEYGDQVREFIETGIPYNPRTPFMLNRVEIALYDIKEALSSKDAKAAEDSI